MSSALAVQTRLADWVRLEGTTVCHLLKQGHTEHMAQDCIQFLPGYLQKGRLPSPSGQAVPVHDHCTGKFFLLFRWNSLCIGVCPLPPVLLPGTTIYTQNIQANYCTQGQKLSRGSHCCISSHVYEKELQRAFANPKAQWNQNVVTITKQTNQTKKQNQKPNNKTNQTNKAIIKRNNQTSEPQEEFTKAAILHFPKHLMVSFFILFCNIQFFILFCYYTLFKNRTGSSLMHTLPCIIFF